MKKIISFLIVFLLTIVSAEAAKQQPRKFYLTQDRFTGAQALTACANGYHMASLWEILDTSNLKYDTSLGLVMEDSGYGPPAGFAGWIHTGSNSAGLGIVGQGNCFAWTSVNDADYGTTVSLISNWTINPLSIIDPWGGGISSCSSERPVWCVQD